MSQERLFPDEGQTIDVYTTPCRDAYTVLKFGDDYTAFLSPACAAGLIDSIQESLRTGELLRATPQGRT